MKTGNIKIIRHALLLFIIVISIFTIAYTYDDHSDTDCDISGTTNAVDSYGNAVGVGCGGCDHGGGGDGSAGSIYECISAYVDCYSLENICGWKNVGSIDISCGESCNVVKPDDPVFNISNKPKMVGDECTVVDNCGNVYTGVVTCEGRCLTNSIRSSCIVIDDDADYNIMTSTDVFTTNTSELSFLDLFRDSYDIWPPDNNTRSVALIAQPPIVRENQSARLYLALIGLDFCVVSGDNGDEWKTVGLSEAKYEYVNEHKMNINQKMLENVVSCDNQNDVKDKTKNNSTNTFSFISWINTYLFGSNTWLFSLLGYDPASTDEEVYSCLFTDLEVDPNIKLIGSVAAFESSPLETETVFTVKKCYAIDHVGRAIEYIPSIDNGDIVNARVKVVPRFIEF